jgi:hypothetical protein
MLMRGDRDLELDFIREFAGRPIEMRRTVKARTEV